MKQVAWHKKYGVMTIEKAIFSENVAIRDIYLQEARKRGIPLHITLEGKTYEVNPHVWIKTGQRIEKVFLIPDKPMVLYQNYLNKFPEVKEEVNADLGPMMNFDVRKRLAEEWKNKLSLKR